MSATIPQPLALVAEITHRCPLHCIYCSNPLELARRDGELSTEIWARALREAAELGVLQADFTGGEPLARNDLAELIGAARSARLYASLITSGLPLDEKRLEELVRAGLDHLQLSFQGAREQSANEFAGAKAHAHKLRVAAWVKQHRIGLTLNFVIHRQNLDQLEEMLALTEEIGPGRVEFAHVQYYGWAFANRERLLPTREQLDRSLEILKIAQERLRGRIRVEYVVPDYYARYPKACMGGWGRKVMLITPRGDVLPCHAAQVIPGMTFENVGSVLCDRSGKSQMHSECSAARTGCRNPAEAASAARKISAVAAARRFSWRETRQRPTRSVLFRRSATKWTRSFPR